MKCIVGILAAGLFLGCGVGADDPEGQAAVAGYYVTSSAAQALTGDPNVPPQTAQTQAQTAAMPNTAVPTAIGATTVGSGGGGTVSAPQDPIPALERRKNSIDPAPIVGGVVAGATSSGQ